MPRIVPSEITTAELVLTPLIKLQFLITAFVTGVVPFEPIQIIDGVVAELFIMERSCVFPFVESEPSIVT